MFIFSFSEGTNMNEIIEYLDRIGHKLGIGGFDGVIGAVVILLAALVLVVHSLSLLRRTGTARNQRDGHITNPLEWMEDADKTIGCDQKSKAYDPSWDMLPENIWHKKCD
jgi:hypothetical protein